MDRRTFIGALSGGILAGPLAAEAQPAAERTYTVGTLSVGFNDDPAHDWWQPFLDAMRELGYVEGRNLVLKRASAAGRPDRLPGLAGNLVRAKVDVIVTTSMRETRAARQATSTIPIVMTFAQDPVAYGLVASLARPGGNVTGLTSLVPGLRQKYVELLKEALPSASRFAVIATPPGLVPDNLRELEAATRALGMSLSLLPVHGPNDFEGALIQARKDGVAGIIATADPVTFENQRTFVQLLLKHRLPAIYWTREYVDAGGLMTYSANLADLRRHAAIYVDKIFKGARPADLPIEQPTKFELVINIKTAKALGLTIPPSLLQRADQVIE
jgi:putative ABC transport system substrate-binding protein